jgi:hypothetical protein
MLKCLAFVLALGLAWGEASIVQGENHIGKGGEGNKSAEADNRGTEKSPLVVNEHAIQSKEEAAKEAERDAEQNRVNERIIDLTFAIAICAALQFLGILGQILVYLKQTKLMESTLGAIETQANEMALQHDEMERQAGYMKDQTEILGKSVAATQKAADAAEKSAKAAMGVAVPTLMLHKFKFVRDPEVYDDRTFLRFPKIEVTVRNFGQSPAFLKAWGFQFVWEEELPPKPIYDFPYPCDTEEVIEPRDTYTLDPETTQATGPTPEVVIDDLIARRKYLTVYGFVSYGDIFGSPIRYMKFSKRLEGFDIQRNYVGFMDYGGYEYTGQHEHYDAPNQKWPKPT